MNAIIRESKEKISKVNPWLIILLTAPIPLLVFGYLAYRWTVARTDYNRMASHLIQRQNAVLAQDAIGVAKEVSHLLESAARDIQVLALIPPTPNHFLKFYISRISQITQVNPRDDSVETVPLPIYNEIIFLNLRGDELVRLKSGQQETSLRKFENCQLMNLCDPELIARAKSASVGELFFGRPMRWYTPEGGIEVDEGAHLPIVYRASEGIFIIGIEYRYFKDLLTEPTFPYERRRNLLTSYQNGNYVYLVDSNMDFIVHPKYWHVTGIERSSGKRAVPMQVDSEEGKHPLSVSAYKGERLKEYFQRLLTKSFLQKSVDLFEAPNLKGTNRVLTVAPILTSKGQFHKSGVFGYVILGCSVDFFEEPKEQYVPYY